MGQGKLFHVRKVDGKVIKPYIKIKSLYYTYYNLYELDTFKRKTEEYFKYHEGIFLLYNEENKSIIKFETRDGKMVRIFKTKSSGDLYPLWSRWLRGYTRL